MQRENERKETRRLYRENRTSAGDPLSTILFNMVPEKTIRSSKLNRDGELLHIIRYADDLAVVTRNEEGLKDVTQRLTEEA